MSYEIISKIKNEVELFNNAKFVSISQDNNVIIENVITKAVYEIPYEETDDGIILNTSEAIVHKEPMLTTKQQFLENKSKVSEAILNVFSEDFEEAIDDLKTYLKKLPTVSSEMVNEEVETEEDEDEVNNNTCFNESFNEKISNINKLKKDFMNESQLFLNDGSLNSHDVGISAFNKYTKDLENDLKSFDEAVEKYKIFTSQLLDVVEDKKIVDYVVESIVDSEKLSIAIPKALVLAKHEYDEDINIPELTTKINNFVKETFNEDGINPSLSAPFIFNLAQNANQRPKYLKFKIGEFTMEDAMSLSAELDHAMSHIGDIDDQELEFIANQKAIVEYMVRTRKINDRAIKQVINEFNNKFAKTNNDEYTRSQLGFKDREEAEEGNSQGKADIGDE